MPKLLPDPSAIWRRNHPWAPVYAFALNHPPVAVAGGRLMMGTDMRLLYRATDALGELPDGSSVLDVPCGGGVALRGLRREQEIRYVAADIAEAMLARTEQEAERLGLTRVETRQADIGALPFDDGEFDLCVSFTGLHCFPDPHAAVAEIGRVVKPGGRVSGSWVVSNPRPLRRPVVTIGRLSGLMGPSATVAEVRAWLAEARFGAVAVVESGPIAYFTAARI